MAEILLLVSGYYSDAHGCRNQITLHNDVGQDWVQLFPSYFGLRLCGDGKSMLPAGV